MKKKRLCAAAAMLAAFAAWTVLLRFVDVRAIGPAGSSVGFAALNRSFHRLTGVNMLLYTVTDFLGFVPIATALGFALFGLVQLGKRKSIRKIDRSILALGVFYIAVVAAYLLFEAAVINYRPVLINGRLEASYPSSTTVLFACVMPTAAMQFRMRIRCPLPRRCAIAVTVGFTAVTVVGRLLSGVHWITDIIGGLLLGAGLVTAYSAFAGEI